MAKELLALVDAGTIRVIDVLILTKNEDGTVEPMELSDVGELGELQALEAQLAELLAADDVVQLAAAVEPGSTARVADDVAWRSHPRSHGYARPGAARRHFRVQVELQSQPRAQNGHLRELRRTVEPIGLTRH